ncbi:MAG: NADP-dependent oxidoreductase [Proteobacteria bacterium]|nr:NADP-dependent oxidoreductase [Pseudomonadota bacterium]MDA1059255.1 NADP-dependent oxidoreductase [Pseudomonadota bacterium]
MINEPNLQVRVRRIPDGIPKVNDLEIVAGAVVRPGPGELLAKTIYLVVDPYVRSRLSGRHFDRQPQPGDLMLGRTVSQVIESRVDGVAAGDIVCIESGMQQYAVVDGSDVIPIDPTVAPLSTALGILGMPGLTAWSGLCVLDPILPGETLLVTAASGAVGSMAGQIAKLSGARAIGLAGSDEKCAWARDVAGFDACLNYKTSDWSAELARLCPDGVSVYFDNAGGDILNTVVKNHLAMYGRVLICGLIAQYNLKDAPPGPNLGPVVSRRAQIKGLVVYDFEDRRADFLREAIPWFQAGKLHYKEELHDGIETAPAVFSRLMSGQNFGKTILRVADDPTVKG